MSSHLLDERIVREFIAHGYTLVQADQPPDFHRQVSEKLDAILAAEGNPGNNILPRVPEMRHVLNSPEVHGALISVLGADYLEHPHRYCHPLKPSEQPVSEQQAYEGMLKNSHQDGYTPMGHPRQHYLRYARIMYYPQDSPVELGPTHVIPGTQFNRGLTDEDRARTLPVAGAAPTRLPRSSKSSRRERRSASR